MSDSDTIFALSSGSVPSGVAIIRLSGDQTADILAQICGSLPLARQALLRSIRDRDGKTIDQGLVLFFPAPASYTGEDCGELQVHGGRAVVAALLQLLSSFNGLRLAEPGEFTRRAFRSGKIDLVEVEGLSDLISADTEMQRRLAIEHAEGGQSALYDRWAHRLTHARAMIEAELDFSDEEDVAGSVSDEIWSDMRQLADEMIHHIDGAKSGEIIRDGLRVVITGRPNCGKSSLMNCLAGRDVAIVTDVAGTTRDLLTVNLSLCGFSVILVDTAGIRHSDDLVEREGIRRAEATLSTAHLILSLSDQPARFVPVSPGNAKVPVLRVGTKIDCNDGVWDTDDADVLISSVTGAGIDVLLHKIAGFLPEVRGGGVLSLPARARHVGHIRDASASVAAASDGSAAQLEIRAEFLRAASDSLGRLTGRVDVEDLLDIVFSQFCIGK